MGSKDLNHGRPQIIGIPTIGTAISPVIITEVSSSKIGTDVRSWPRKTHVMSIFLIGIIFYVSQYNTGVAKILV